MEDLCQLCKRIDLDRVFSMKINKRIRLDCGKVVMDLNATKKELEDSDCGLCDLFACAAWKTPGSEPNDAMRHISEFSRRELTYPEDRLNAMKGIFHLFERSKLPIYQIIGVPILPPTERENDHSKYGHKIERTAEQSFLVGLTWRSGRAGKRDPYFSSWSWAGWTGDLYFDLMTKPEYNHAFQKCTIWFESAGGKFLRFPGWDDLPNFISDIGSSNRTFIHIETHTVLCSIVCLEALGEGDESMESESQPSGRPPTGYYATIQCDEATIYMKVYFDCEEYDMSRKYLTAILVGDLRAPGGLVTLLYVEERNDSYAEQVGSGQLGESFTLWRGEWIENNYGNSQQWVKANTEERTIRLG
jgi:hypothetical protein